MGLIPTYEIPSGQVTRQEFERSKSDIKTQWWVGLLVFLISIPFAFIFVGIIGLWWGDKMMKTAKNRKAELQDNYIEGGGSLY